MFLFNKEVKNIQRQNAKLDAEDEELTFTPNIGKKANEINRRSLNKNNDIGNVSSE